MAAANDGQERLQQAAGRRVVGGQQPRGGTPGDLLSPWNAVPLECSSSLSVKGDRCRSRQPPPQPPTREPSRRRTGGVGVAVRRPRTDDNDGLTSSDDQESLSRPATNLLPSPHTALLLLRRMRCHHGRRIIVLLFCHIVLTSRRTSSADAGAAARAKRLVVVLTHPSPSSFFSAAASADVRSSSTDRLSRPPRTISS